MSLSRQIVLAIGVLAAFLAPAAAQELARRPFMGIAMASGAAVGSAPSGILIERVVEGSSAEKAGLRAGDLVTFVNGQPSSAPGDLAAALKSRRAGDSVTLSILRDGEPMDRQVALIGLPYETAPDFDIAYEAVTAEGSLRRTILMRPRREGRSPAVLFVGGIGCYSMESPFDDKEVYRQLLSSLTRRGFITMRVEKSGMGDSEGAPCADADMDNELKGYLAGLTALKARPDVDAGRVFILGHSIGGILAPLIARDIPVKGIVATETAGKTWVEYELANRRRQLKLAGIAPEALGRRMQLKEWCMHRLLIERQPRREILAERPACETEMVLPASDAYLQQIASLDLPALWSRVSGDVLLVYGSADYLTSADEHREIAWTINATRPGAATFVEIPDLDHFMTRAKDQAESFARKRAGETGDYNPAFGEAIGAWLDARSG